MGIAELATRLLADPHNDGRQPPMGEGEVRSQLYGESNTSNNVITIGRARAARANGRKRARSRSGGSEEAAIGES
jgi:hypothetical protein